MINPNTYYTVQGWMRSELGLKGTPLAVYAIIYGFSQDGNSEYAGSARYLCEWVGCSRSTMMDVLKKLVEDGLLIKRDIYQNGIQFCAYRTAARGCPTAGQGVQNLDRGVSENWTGGVQNLDRGCPNPGHNNNRDIYRDNNREINKESMQAAPATPPQDGKKKEKQVKHKYGEYKNVLLTDEELEKLRQEFPHDLQQRIDRLSEYIASTGKSYKSHYATIKAWARRDKGQAPAPGRRAAGPMGPNGIVLDESKTDLDGMF